VKKHRVLVIGDTHFPFHSKSAYSNLISFAKKIKPTHIVQIGDLLDQYVFSSFSRSLDVSPKEEIDYGLNLAADMWTELQKIAPRAKCYQIIGNHDVRLSKRISERLPELSSFFSFRNLYKFDGVKVMDSDRDYLKIGGIIYTHGWLSKSLDHAKFFGSPVVHGHRHRPCIEYENKNLWSMDVGYMADEKSLPLQYTSSKWTKWTSSCGVVENGVPRIIPL
jgi:UDP-2,3-diacylglucosamine pyrophosphatase LpxH